MTADPGPVPGEPADRRRRGVRLRMDRLAPRLLLAVSAIALAAVGVLAAASFVGVDRGLSTAEQAERQSVTDEVARLVADAHAESGGWSDIDLAPALAAAQGAGARLVVRPHSAPVGPGMGSGAGGGAGSTTADVVVDGTAIGTVRLVFGAGAGTTARDVSWTWIAVATLLAVTMAVGASWWVSRRISAPLVTLADSARAFGAGNREVRAATDGPGEIGDVARSFNQMADQVVAGEEAHRRLAADVAHELRTPLAVLQAHLEEARDGLVEPTPDLLAALHDQTLRLGRVVDDLGTLAAAESPRAVVHPRPTDLAAVAERTLTAHRVALSAAGIEAETVGEGPVMALADPDRVGQALTNLLANASRYCRSGDRVLVTVDHDAAGSARIEVADTGPGIPAADLPHVFDRFYRGAGTTAVPGSGLGLPVVRALVEAQGGQVSIRSAPGSGTAIRLLLPAIPSGT